MGIRKPNPLAIICCSAILVIACNHKPPADQSLQSTASTPATTSSPEISSVAREAQKCVVTILANGPGGSESVGSGFLVSEDGKIVTNYHVVAQATGAVAKFSDGAFYEIAGVLGSDPKADIAVLKLKASSKKFPFLRLANSDLVEVGQQVVAIGSPITLEGTVSNGIVSSTREVGDVPFFANLGLNPALKVIQITAPISHGSSGGALLNTKGEVIGVTAIALNAVGGENLNFAIPSNYASPFVVGDNLKTFSEISEAIAVTATSPNRPSGRVATKPREPEMTLRTGELSGNYTGGWQSAIYTASGAAVMNVSVDGKRLIAKVALTGGNVTETTMTGDIKQIGGGWSVTLRTEEGNLYAKGIFKNGAFIGDYDYVPASDRGQWILKKD